MYSQRRLRSFRRQPHRLRVASERMYQHASSFASKAALRLVSKAQCPGSPRVSAGLSNQEIYLEPSCEEHRISLHAELPSRQEPSR